MKTDLDVDLNGHCLAVFAGWFKCPFLHSFNGFLIQAETERTHHTDIVIARFTIRTDHEPKHADSLIFCFASLFGVLRGRLVNRSWGRYTTNYLEHIAAFGILAH